MKDFKLKTSTSNLKVLDSKFQPQNFSLNSSFKFRSQNFSFKISASEFWFKLQLQISVSKLQFQDFSLKISVSGFQFQNPSFYSLKFQKISTPNSGPSARTASSLQQSFSKSKYGRCRSVVLAGVRQLHAVGSSLVLSPHPLYSLLCTRRGPKEGRVPLSGSPAIVKQHTVLTHGFNSPEASICLKASRSILISSLSFQNLNLPETFNPSEILEQNWFYCHSHHFFLL